MSYRALFSLGLGLLLGGCVTQPTHMYDLMDATRDADVEDAVSEAAEELTSRSSSRAVRMAAAKALGRLRSDDVRALDALRNGLHAGQPADVRRFSAWALGEIRSRSALPILCEALRSDIDDKTGAYVLEGVAKHYSLMAGDESTLLLVVEAMVFYGGNRSKSVPAIYDLLGARTRTVGVNVTVLRHAIDELSRDPRPQTRASLYNATLELLTKLAARREEIQAGPAAWSARVDAAFEAANAALEAEPSETALLVLWYLGHLATDQEFGAPAARVVVGPQAGVVSRGTVHPRSAARLVAVWATARMQVHALGPRRALLLDILSREIEPEVLRLFGDLSINSKEVDALQRVLQPQGADS